MMTNPDMVFATDPRHGLVARSGWEQEEARTVLRDLGWEWEEELHALVPPDDVPEVDAGVQAVLELHRHGHRTGYLQGPYGTMLLRLAEADQVFTQMTTGKPPAATRPQNLVDDPPRRTAGATPPPYGDRCAGNIDNASPEPSSVTPEM
ncbi:hypothetical protein AB0C96_12025 [Streptomyces sp. NPDC048506]|uniref:hypothetical protein n=1 Tax=Streptomyces sp. NPDC048506 TaxID=3155028 RepID=UPI003429348D